MRAFTSQEALKLFGVSICERGETDCLKRSEKLGECCLVLDRQRVYPATDQELAQAMYGKRDDVILIDNKAWIVTHGALRKLRDATA